VVGLAGAIPVWSRTKWWIVWGFVVPVIIIIIIIWVRSLVGFWVVLGVAFYCGSGGWV
jgi:hypothetical protein